MKTADEEEILVAIVDEAWPTGGVYTVGGHPFCDPSVLRAIEKAEGLIAYTTDRFGEPGGPQVGDRVVLYRVPPFGKRIVIGKMAAS